LKLAKKLKNEIFKSDAKIARKKLEEICNLIQSSSSSNQYPSSETILLQECLQQCLAMITKPKVLFP
jgi:vacuolar-type H+-ATPase subunit H